VASSQSRKEGGKRALSDSRTDRRRRVEGLSYKQEFLFGLVGGTRTKTRKRERESNGDLSRLGEGKINSVLSSCYKFYNRKGYENWRIRDQEKGGKGEDGKTAVNWGQLKSALNEEMDTEI